MPSLLTLRPDFAIVNLYKLNFYQGLIIKTNHSILYESPRLFGVVDVFIIGALIVASITFIPFLHSHPRDTVEVYKVDNVIARYPLNEDRTFSVEGRLGTLEVEIKENRVRVLSSPCPHQICRDTGWISEAYEQIVCAPNLIFITLQSDSENEKIDAVTR